MVSLFAGLCKGCATLNLNARASLVVVVVPGLVAVVVAGVVAVVVAVAVAVVAVVGQTAGDRCESCAMYLQARKPNST